MAEWLVLIPLLPLAAFLVNILLGRGYIRDNAHWISVPAVFGSFLLSVFVFLDIRDSGHAISQHLFTWIPAGTFDVGITLFADQLTAVMLLVVTSVGLLVHVYSIGYMKGDGGYYRFFSYLPLFVFSMLMLVLADNFLVLFVFWEAVGLCSFFLIGFWFKRRSAVNAAKKAFIVNRIGDLGFGLGIMLVYWTFDTIKFYGEDGVFARVGEAESSAVTWIALLLFIGACGKSAQFPLHVWLPDAMEGPTPVSALIHAATMVTAGVYMVFRAFPFYEASEGAAVVVALIGTFTAFMAATIACTQNDIKRIVAYSTLSQLGYMVAGLGVAAYVAADFHLTTHAMFKGLLFLGCGAVIHGMHEEQNIQKMGNLRKYMPITYWTFLLAALANAGLFPLAGFWSKDELIVGAWISESGVGKFVAVMLLIAAFLTAFYMFRLVFLVFFTKERFDTAHIHPHDPPWTMKAPLLILAVPTVILGLLIGWPPEEGPIHTFLEPVTAGESFVEGGTGEDHAAATRDVASLSLMQETSPAADGEEHAGDEEHAEEGAAGAGVISGEEHAEEHHVSATTLWAFGIISSVVALAGIALAYVTYVQRRIDYVALADRYSGLYLFLFEKWRFDELYDRIFVRPLARLSYDLWQVVDVGIIDATVNGVATGIGALSQRLRQVQTGLVANYALAIALGMVLLVGIYLTGFSNIFR